MVLQLNGKTIGRYKLIDAVGKGGTSVVYRALQTDLTREVAVKVMSFDPVESPEYALRFMREASIIARLQHPNILPIFDYGEYTTENEDKCLYLVTPLMKGGSLKQYITDNGPLTLAQATNIMKLIGRALHYAHERDFIHRDVNPRNILLDEHGNPYLSDFGLARANTGEAITLVGYIGGTKAYMPPEQWVGDDLDRRTDVYSLGVTLFEVLTNRQPFTSESRRDLALQHLQDPPPSVLAFAPHLPREVEGLIKKAMAKNPADRYQTVEEMVKALSRITSRTQQETETAAQIPVYKKTWADDEDEESTLQGLRERLILIFDVALEHFQLKPFIALIEQMLLPDHTDAEIQMISLHPGSAILTLEMTHSAAEYLFRLIMARPAAFIKYRLVHASFRDRSLDLSLLYRQQPVFLKWASKLAVVIAGVAMMALLFNLGSRFMEAGPILTPESQNLSTLALPMSTVTPTPLPATATMTETAEPATMAGGNAALSETPQATTPATTVAPEATATPTTLPPSPTATATPTSIPPSPTATATSIPPTATATAVPTVTPSLTPEYSIPVAVERAVSAQVEAAESAQYLLTFMYPEEEETPTPLPTHTPIPPTRTPVPTNTPVPPTRTPVPPTRTPVPTSMPVPPPPPTNTPVPPPPPTDTPVPPPPTDIPTGAVCGNGICEPSESNKCSADCFCGNGTCDGGENKNNCSADCQ